MRFLALSFFIIAQSIALGGNVVLGNIGTLSWAGSAPNYIAQFAQPVGNIASIATAATANPATTSLQLSGGQNAVRVWTAQAANPAETNFTLNVLNSAAAYPVLLNNWQGRIINCIPGSSVAFGTVDGRTLRMAAMTVPASLAVFADYCVTGIANCDRAGPLIWEPSTKVTLSANNLSIKFFPTNVEEIVFVSENDGVQWSPPIWFRLTTNQPVFCQCTYKQIAIANYDGQPLAVGAPAGSTISGSSHDMIYADLFPTTGTVWFATNVNDVQTFISNAVAPATLLITNGTFAFITNFTERSFTANNAAGFYGSEGLNFYGMSTNLGDVVFTGATTNAGNFNITIITNRFYTVWKNIQFNLTNNSDASLNIIGGNWRWGNMDVWGSTNAYTGGIGLVNLGPSANVPQVFDAIQVSVHGSPNDNWSASGAFTNTPTEMALNSNCIMRLINCIGYNSGTNAADQDITTHFGLSLFAFGGYYTNSRAVIAVGNPATETVWTYFSTLFSGRSNESGIQGCELYGCNMTSIIGPPNSLWNLFTRMLNTAASANWIRDIPTVFHGNIIASTHKTVALFNSNTNAYFTGNILDGWNEAFELYGASSTQSLSVLIQNTLVNNDYAIDTESTKQTCIATNNACGTNTTSIINVAGAMIAADYNVLDTTVSGYTLNTHDVSADAALGINYLPLSGGNCDSTGTNNSGYVGDSDPYGNVLFYSFSQAPKGARNIATNYPAAKLWPDLW